MEDKRLEAIGGLIGLILFAAFMFYLLVIGPAKDEENQAKRDMLGMLQKYSMSTITVEDFDIEKVEKSKTHPIYRVSVKKSNFQITGDFYVALIRSNGNITDKVMLHQDLYKLKESI